jgi:protease I
MSKKALFIIPPERFNEDELFHPKEALENEGVEVTIASTKTGEIIGDYQGKVESTVIFSDVSFTDYDVIAVIGGSVTVVKTGLLEGRTATCYPLDVQINVLKENKVNYIPEHVVAHKDIITGDGPDGAKEFGQSLVKALR